MLNVIMNSNLVYGEFKIGVIYLSDLDLKWEN